MASPQLENGYVGVANELAEILARTNLSSYESRFLWFLWRKTYGWHKKDDIISNSQFVQGTGLKKWHVSRTKKRLIQRNIVASIGNKLSFQKDYTRWIELPKQATVAKIGNRVASIGNKKLPKQVDTKATIKETITKDRITGDVPSPDINTLISAFKGVNPSYERLFANRSERAAAERLVKKYGLPKMLDTVKALPTVISQPYAPKITSPYSLERDLGKLLLFVGQQKQITNKTTKVAFT